MKTVRFYCKKCGCKFEAIIYEPGEKEEKREQGSPVTCKNCGSTNVVRT